MINANTSSEWSSDSKPKTIRNAPYFVGKAASPRLLTFMGVKYITQDLGLRRQLQIVGRPADAVRSIGKQTETGADNFVSDRPTPGVQSNEIGHVGWMK